MRALVLLLLLTGCTVMKTFNRSVSRLDSSVQRLTHVRSESTQTREESTGWQQFRFAGTDTIVRLADLRIENSIVPSVPQFVRGQEKIIYLPTERVIETHSTILDSLALENTRLLSEIRSRERTVERKSDPVLTWWLLSALVLVNLIQFLRNR